MDALEEAIPFLMNDVAILQNELKAGLRYPNDIILDESRKRLQRASTALAKLTGRE